MYDIDKYKKDERQYKSTQDSLKTLMPREADTQFYEPKKPRTIIVTDHQAMPRMPEDEIKPLKLVTTEVIGNIFDRVRFLDQRICEINRNLDLRTGIHNSIVKEIDKDIDDKSNMIIALSDVNERRNLKLDISILRKEKRHEDVQFWKDMMELNTELKQLTEDYETEKKIAAIFGDIDNAGVKNGS
jgi:hypothetical protein